MFSSSMRRASIKTVLSAFGTMCLGAGLMALLGKWYVLRLVYDSDIANYSPGLRFNRW